MTYASSSSSTNLTSARVSGVTFCKRSKKYISGSRNASKIHKKKVNVLTLGHLHCLPENADIPSLRSLPEVLTSGKGPAWTGVSSDAL